MGALGFREYLPYLPRLRSTVILSTLLSSNGQSETVANTGHLFLNYWGPNA